MIWSKIKTLIDSGNSQSFKELLTEAGFWQSSEPLFVRTAYILREKGRLDEALFLIETLVKKRSDISLRSIVLLKHIQAECLLDKKQFKKAISVYNSLLYDVEDSTAYANRGLAHWELRQYKNALSDYSKATILNPNDALAHRSAGELLNKLGKYAKAVKHLKTAILLDPECSRSYCALGTSYYNLKDWLKAYRALKRAVAIDPRNKIAQLGLRKIERHFELTQKGVRDEY